MLPVATELPATSFAHIGKLVSRNLKVYMKPLGPNDKERVSAPFALQQFLLRVRQVVEVFGFLKVFAVAAHQNFIARNIQKGLPVHFDLRGQEIHHGMRNDRQSSFIFSCPLLHIAQEHQGLRNLRVDHQICLVTYQQAALIPVAAHFLPTPAQQIQILRALDIIRRILQVVGIQANKPGIGLQRGVTVPQKAVAARCGVVQQHCQITIYRILLVGLRFLFQQGVKVGQNGKIRGLELPNIRFPEDAELIVEFNDRLLEDRFLHIRQAGQIQGKFNLQRFHVQRHIRHSVSFICIEFIGFIVIVIETVIGVIFGGIAGYFGGWVDNLIMRVVDIFYCIPSMPIIIILGAAMDAQRVDGWLRMIYLMLILGFLGWAGIARLVRGQILSLREQEFMTATEACGISVSRRIFKHLIPNVIPQLIVNCTMGLGSVIITEATLSFLGLGVKFPFASWGNIISDMNNTHVLTNYWWVWIPAGLLLLLTVLAFNLAGDGLRDAFDPKMKR